MAEVLKFDDVRHGTRSGGQRAAKFAPARNRRIDTAAEEPFCFRPEVSCGLGDKRAAGRSREFAAPCQPGNSSDPGVRRALCAANIALCSSAAGLNLLRIRNQAAANTNPRTSMTVNFATVTALHDQQPGTDSQCAAAIERNVMKQISRKAVALAGGLPALRSAAIAGCAFVVSLAICAVVAAHADPLPAPSLSASLSANPDPYGFDLDWAGKCLQCHAFASPPGPLQDRSPQGVDEPTTSSRIISARRKTARLE